MAVIDNDYELKLKMSRRITFTRQRRTGVFDMNIKNLLLNHPALVVSMKVRVVIGEPTVIVVGKGECFNKTKTMLMNSEAAEGSTGRIIVGPASQAHRGKDTNEPITSVLV